MPTVQHIYRAYHLDGNDVVCRVELVDADDDEAAMEMVRKIANMHGLELWDQARLVGKAGPLHHRTDLKV